MKKGVDFSTPKKSNFWGSLQVDNSFLFTNQLDIYKLYFLTNFIDILFVKLSETKLSIYVTQKNF